MADRVLMRGAAVTAGEIPGQGCLAQVDDPYKDKWIYQNAAASEVGAGTLHPVGMTLDHLAELYWRFRKIKVDGDVTLTSLDGQGETYDQNITFSNTVERYRGYADSGTPLYLTREAELVEPSPWDYSSGIMELRIFPRSLSSTFQAVKYHGGMYYPMIWVTAYININTPVSSYGAVPPSTVHPLSCTLTMSDGTVYSIPMVHHYFFGVETFTGTIEMYAEEYWPHKKANGTAKYDTTTGAEL